jgi:glucosamine 6-phosphate synthetase-like amidotransferase/phosphosugar isomerase protein
MCGIAAFLFTPKKRSPDVWAEISDVFTKNLLYNEKRGKLATGAAIINTDGTYDRFKKPITATEFVKEEEYHNILDQLSEKTVCLLGHTREPTKGDPTNNLNNHPLIIENQIGVHNGKITNDDALFQEFGYPRLGEVDSEIIFRLFNDIAPTETSYVKKLTAQARLLRGTFATISIDLRKPCCITVIKNKKPLCLHYHEPWEALIFSSRYLFLRKAYGKGVAAEALESGTLFYFTTEDMISLRHLPTEKYKIIVE